MAPPSHFPDYPTFRWPKTRQDFKLLMQRNDVFIIVSLFMPWLNIIYRVSSFTIVFKMIHMSIHHIKFQ